MNQASSCDTVRDEAASRATTTIRISKLPNARHGLSKRLRGGSVNGIVIAGIAIFGCCASWLVINWGSTKSTGNADPVATIKPASPPAKRTFPVAIGKPSGPPRVDTGITDANGNAVTVSCSTCHTTRKPNFDNKTVEDLNEFHGSLTFSHGTVSCLSCHNSNDYDALKLADGSRVEFTDVMTLCAQCHGPQMKDYEHGAHGGMNGYWDLTRGPRTKNNCVDCHNPHSPQFPKMKPTFKPRDRFLEKENH